MKKENIALIGYGYWGRKLYRYLKESKEFDLAYVYFPSLQHLNIKSIHHDYGKEFVSSVEKIWKDELVPNVIIATPINTHFSVVREALLHSKNVLAEKPLTIRLDEARSLKDIAQKKSLLLMTEYTYTFSQALQHAQQIVREETIGPIKSIYITLKQLGRFLDYDVFTLLGTHALSILDLFLPLQGCIFHPRPLMVTNGLVTGGLVFFESKEDGPCGYIDVSLHCPARERRMIIYGGKGTIIYDPYAVDTLTVARYSRERSFTQEDLIQEKKHFYFDENHNLRYALEAFFEAIQHRRGDNIERSISVTSVLELLRGQS